MTDDQQTIQQLQHANNQLVLELGKTRRDFSLSRQLPRKLCQLGASLKQEQPGTPNTVADDCFAVALAVVAQRSIADHCQRAEREAYLELQRVASILDTSVTDLAKTALELADNSQHKRDFSPHELLCARPRTHRMIVFAANTYGCRTLAAVADLPDDKFLKLDKCGPEALRNIRTAFSFGDGDEI